MTFSVVKFFLSENEAKRKNRVVGIGNANQSGIFLVVELWFKVSRNINLNIDDDDDENKNKSKYFCHNYKQCFGMLMSHVCPIEFPQNLKFKSNQFWHENLLNPKFRRISHLLNLYSSIYINPPSPVNISHNSKWQNYIIKLGKWPNLLMIIWENSVILSFYGISWTRIRWITLLSEVFSSSCTLPLLFS